MCAICCKVYRAQSMTTGTDFIKTIRGGLILMRFEMVNYVPLFSTVRVV
jgi:hypothetical protein